MKINTLKLKEARKKVWITLVELSDLSKIRLNRLINVYRSWNIEREELEKIVNIINLPRFIKWFRCELLKKYPVNYFIIKW